MGVKVIQKGRGAEVGGDAETSFCSFLSEGSFQHLSSHPALTWASWLHRLEVDRWQAH